MTWLFESSSARNMTHLQSSETYGFFTKKIVQADNKIIKHYKLSFKYLLWQIIAGPIWSFHWQPRLHLAQTKPRLSFLPRDYFIFSMSGQHIFQSFIVSDFHIFSIIWRFEFWLWVLLWMKISLLKRGSRNGVRHYILN